MADTAAQTEPAARFASEASASPIARRVAELRKGAQSSPATAADAAWGWFRELGDHGAMAPLGPSSILTSAISVTRLISSPILSGS